MTKDFERWYERYGTYNSDYTGQIPAHVAAEIKRVAWRAWKARAKKAEQDARRYRLLLQFIRYEAEPDGFQWATMEWCVEVASLAPATLQEAIDAAIDGGGGVTVNQCLI